MGKKSKFNDNDFFVIGSNANGMRVKHHQERVNWVGLKGKTFKEICKPPSPYLNQPKKVSPSSHIQYDLDRKYIMLKKDKKFIFKKNILNNSNKGFWWVNQGQTHEQEIDGGYMWSPKTNSDGSKSKFYDYMTEVKPGDFIFSYYKGKIQKLGIAISTALDTNKPEELKERKEWNTNGWLVKVEYSDIENPQGLKKHINEIKPYLPEKYSPLQHNGNANQAYLFKISKSFSDYLISLIGEDFNTAISFLEDEFEDTSSDDDIDFGIDENNETYSEQVVKARKGQGIFKRNVWRVEKQCRVSSISNILHLRASHIKPWKDSNNKEKLDGYNGLMLSPHIDHLFDRGFISFEDNGELLISSQLDKQIIEKWKLKIPQTRGFHKRQCRYLKYHRKNIFKSN